MEEFAKILMYKSMLLKGLEITLLLGVLDLILASLVGAVTAVFVTSKSKNIFMKAGKWVSQFYVELFRGSPLLLQLFFMYYGLGYFGVRMPLFGSCLLALFLHHGAYICEILRSGIESVPKGQYEAGKCIGLSTVDIIWKIVMPQASRVFMPPLVGYYIGAIKDTPLVSLVGLADMMKNAKMIAGNTNLPLEVYFLVAMVYFVICFPMSRYVKYLEAKRIA